jgi:hypothetical protein
VLQNDSHCAVFGIYQAVTERDRNLVWRLFTGPLAQKVNAEWETLASIYLAQFRAEYGRFINDPWWANEIAELSEASPQFRELWARHDVVSVSEGRKTYHHPQAGTLVFDFLWLQTVDSRDLRLLIHTPHTGSGTAGKIAQMIASSAE